mgnify:CR=1 FL=1
MKTITVKLTVAGALALIVGPDWLTLEQLDEYHSATSKLHAALESADLLDTAHARLAALAGKKR